LRNVTSSNETVLSTLYNEWQILKSEVPKGFEKYFPGGKKTPAKPEEAVKPEQKGAYQLHSICAAFFNYCICCLEFVFIELCTLISHTLIYEAMPCLLLWTSNCLPSMMGC